MKSEELQTIMGNYTGTETYWHNPLMTMRYTDGVKAFVQNAKAGWLLADICAYKEYAKKANPDEYMFSVKLEVELGEGDLVFKDGNGTIRYIHHYTYTDCPDGDWLFYYYVDEDLLIWNGEY